MKNLFVRGSFALLSVMLLLTFFACAEPEPTSKPKATLEKAIDAVYTKANGDEESNPGELGTIITSKEWNAFTLTTAQKAGALNFNDRYTSGISVTFDVTPSKNATVTYTIVKGTAKPQDSAFKAITEPSEELASGDTVYFKVVVKSTTAYYCTTVSGIGSGPSQSVNFTVPKLNETTIDVGSNTAYRNLVLASVVPVTIELPSSLMSGTVIFTLNGANRGQAISWAKVATGVPAETAFAAFTLAATGNTFSATVSTSGLTNDDLIFVKVVAEDPTVTMYYGYKLSLGNIAALTSITFDGKTASRGTPGTAWNNITLNGIIEYGDKLPSGGVAIVAAAEDNGVITYGTTANGTTEPTFAALPGTGKLILQSDGYVYIKVVSVSGSTTAIYKIQVVSQNSVTLLYGQPDIGIPTANKGINTPPNIDPLWATIPWDFDINRTNAQTAVNARFNRTVDGLRSETGYGHTEGKAKALWDDGGIYIYSEITYHDYYDSLTSTDVKVKSTVFATASSSDPYQQDDLEFFTNERLQTYKTGNNGIQYRVNPVQSGGVGDTNSIITGTDNGALPGALATLRGSEKYYSWVRKDAAGKELGYSIIAYVPWMAKGNANATEVFENDKVKTSGDDAGPDIGVEFQLNAMVTSGTRDAILTWNGINFQGYQTVEGFGIVKLVTGNLTQRGITRGAKDPTRVTVTFDKNTGDTDANPTTRTVNQGATVVLPAPPTKADWKFLGWATTNNATEPDFDATTRVNVDIKVFAVWTQNIVITDIPLAETLTFNSNFAYGSGYQYTLNVTTLFANVAVGDKFRISGVYSVNREVKGDIEIGIIKNNPPSYWDPVAANTKFAGPSEVGTEYPFDIVFEITAVPAGGSTFTLYMQTTGESQTEDAALVLTIGESNKRNPDSVTMIGFDYKGVLYDDVDNQLTGSNTLQGNGLMEGLEDGSYLRIYVDTHGNSRSGWGIGTSSGGTLTGKAGNKFFLDIPINWTDKTQFTFNIYNQCTIYLIEVWEYGGPLTWTSIGEITLGDGDGTTVIVGDDLAKILGMKLGSYLEATVDCMSSPDNVAVGWGVGTIGGVGFNCLNKTEPYIVKIQLQEIMVMETTYREGITVNPFNGAVVSKIELFALD